MIEVDVDKSNIHTERVTYCFEKLVQYVQSPFGVDWNGDEGQTLMFRQLCKIIDVPHDFSMNDSSSGYGSRRNFFSREYKCINFCYKRIDLPESLVRAAEERYRDKSQSRFVLSSEPDRVADFVVAGGTFIVRLNRSSNEWQACLQTALDIIYQAGRFGFSFNCLTCYSDLEKVRDYLYYADPVAIFDQCKRRNSHNVALSHDYDLYEFTNLFR